MNGHTRRPVRSQPDGITEAEQTAARLQAARGLPVLLAETFDAFEVIRLLARSAENQQPGQLDVFMTAADAAVDGREAITIAPSLPAGRSRMAAATLPAGGTNGGQVADALARLGELLAGLLTAAAADAPSPDDQAACLQAAQAAARIGELMAGGGGDRHLR